MKKADIILKSNAVFTGTDSAPISGAVAIKGQKIMAVLSEDEIENYISPETQVMSYEDQLIMPGFIDAHDHLWWGAVADSPYMVDVTSSSSEEECVEMIRAFAEEHPEYKRIRGFGWFPANWNDTLPSKRSLDQAVPDRPVYMMCADAHTCWMNSLALEESNYSPDMKLNSGSVGTFENGEMDGLIYEPEALANAWANLYDFSEDNIEKIAENFMQGLASYGITSLSEMSADDYTDQFHKRYKVFQRMDEKGKMTSRVHTYMKLLGYNDFSHAKKWKEEFNSDKFQVTGLKGFLDGVTSTYTGLLLEPYADRPDTCGVGAPLVTANALKDSVIAGNAAGLPVRIHCIADGSVRMALDAFEESRRVNGDHGCVNTIEHIETIHPDDIKRFKELGVIASVQPEHIPLDVNEKVIRVGEERCRWEWPLKSMLQEEAEIAFGSDFPVVHYNPFPGIYAAITRLNHDGSEAGVGSDEYLTLAQALHAYTLGAAKAYGRDHELGSLEAGKLADIVVVDRNLFDIDVNELKDSKILLTMMDGNVTYCA